MSVIRIARDGRAGMLVFVALLTTGCDGSTGPTAGAIAITISTEGASLDLDADGYSVILDGGAPRAVGVNAALTIADLATGNHVVQLDGLEPNCSVIGSNPRSVNVTAGDKTASPMEVFFSVLCIGTGSIHVTTVTTGVDLDPDGYLVEVRLQPSGSFTPGRAPVNGTTAITALTPGTYVVTISEIIANCSVALNPQTVVVDAKYATPIVAFELTCTATPQLAFVNYASNADILKVSINGGAVSRLTGSPGSDWDPAWSPDGSRIAFASERDGNFEIYLMNRDGTKPVRLTTAVGSDVRPAWSPDGARIAFESSRDGNWEIYVMNADGTNPVRLTSQNNYDTDPTWSPDGSRIAFRSNSQILVMNADGSGQASLTSGEFDRHPQWSPDGTRIAFSRRAASARAEAIYIMNADGSRVTRLTSEFDMAEDPTWSPDGRKIAFAGLVSYNYYTSYLTQIFVVGIDGINYTPPTYLPASNPAWSPR